MAYAVTQDIGYFFDPIETHSNFIEEGFESLLANPLRVAQELVLARKDDNYVSNVYGRLVASTFIRERGQDARWRSLCDRKMLGDHDDRPFLIVNGTVNYRPPEKFQIVQECFEMTNRYCGSRSLGYVHSKDLKTTERQIRGPTEHRTRSITACGRCCDATTFRPRSTGIRRPLSRNSTGPTNPYTSSGATTVSQTFSTSN